MNPSTKWVAFLSLILSLYITPSFAIGKREISVTNAENGISLSLSRGYGVVLNLSTIGQTVSTAWLSDPSQITLASNKGPCTGEECAGASILYLKPINKLSFPGLPSASDGASLLSVITNQGKVFQFKLTVNSSVPSYTNIALIPPITPIYTPKPDLVQASVPTPTAVLPPTPETLTPVPKPKIKISLPKTEREDLKILTQLVEKVKGSKKSKSEEPNTPETVEPLVKEKDITKESQSIEPDTPETVEPLVKEKDVPKYPQPEEPDTPEPVDPLVEEKEATEEPQPIEADTSDQEELIQVAVVTPAPVKPISLTNQDIASAILRGLHSTKGRAEVGRQSIHYRLAQDVIYLLKKHPELPLEQAIKRIGMDPKVAQALIGYGAR